MAGRLARTAILFAIESKIGEDGASVFDGILSDVSA
jgi:hypothetical protein